MGQPAHRFLEEFQLDDTCIMPAKPAVRAAAQRRDRDIDRIAEQVAEAHARGFAEGEAAAQEIAQEKVHQLIEEQASAMQALRRRLGEEFASRLTDELNAQLAQVRARVSAQIATVLLAFMRRRLTEDMIFQMAGEIAGILESDRALVVDVHGPLELAETVRAVFEARHAADDPGMASRVRYRVSDSPELVVTCDDSIIETRLSEWIERLREAR